MCDFENVLVRKTELAHKIAHAESGYVFELRPRVASLRIIVEIQGRHAYLLPLIYEVRARKERVSHCKRLSALDAEVLVAVAGDDARVIVIFEIVGVPGSVIEFRLPLVESLFEFDEIERRVHPLDEYAIRAHVLEGNHHIQLFLVFVDVSERGLDVHKRRFANLKRVVIFDDLSVFLQILVDMRTVVVVFHTP